MNQIILPSAVYSDTHSPKMSDRYVHIRTSDVLERFQDMGWLVSSASAPRHSKTPEFARHAIRLRHKDYLDINQDGTIPELIVLNSHNGSWALRMALGMFRIVCANGMVAGKLWEGISLRHYNIKNVEEKVELITNQMGGLANTLADSINQWRQIDVPLADQLEFANRARQIRWGDREPVEAGQLLEARRDADKGSNLWTVFNRVQENLTQGGYRGHTSNNRAVDIKPVKNVKRDFKFNSELYDLASEYADKVLH